MSSDSEDDCYTNAAKKLKIMESKYKDEISNFSINETVDDEEEIELLVPKIPEEQSPIRTCGNFKLKSLDDFDKPPVVISNPRRVLTRSEARKRSIEVTNTPAIVNNVISQKKTVINAPRKVTIPSKKKSPAKGRGKGKTKRRNLPTPVRITPPVSGIIYSVGNTEDYPDMLHNQELFKKNSATNEVIIDDDILEDSILEDNEEMSVKVYWQNCNVVTFNIRKYQKIIQIYEYFALKNNLEFNNLLFMYNGVILKPDDTPDTFNYNIAKFIDGGIIKNCVKSLDKSKNNQDDNKLLIKFQYISQNKIKQYELRVLPNEVVLKSMVKCAEYLETSCNNLKFLFDGDKLPATKTFLELDFEGGEIIDVVFINESVK